jgi:hypothetical protein
VCCDKACTEQCEACDLQGAKGTCKVLPAGQTPRGSRLGCMGQGTCAGACSGMSTQCVYPTSSTQCGDKACSGTTIMSYLCDGNGMCRADAAQCQNGYCSNLMCAPTKPNGTLCATNLECSSGTCGGRCCANTCLCRQPTAENLAINPGFDVDVSGWDVITTGAIQRSQSDSEGCPYSGSAAVIAPGPSNNEITQCVPVDQSRTYNFGGRLLGSDGNGQNGMVGHWNVYCGPWWYGSLSDCKSRKAPISSAPVQWIYNGPANTWVAYSTENVAVPPNATHARFGCVLSNSETTSVTVSFDQLYLAVSPSKY